MRWMTWRAIAISGRPDDEADAGDRAAIRALFAGEARQQTLNTSRGGLPIKHRGLALVLKDIVSELWPALPGGGGAAGAGVPPVSRVCHLARGGQNNDPRLQRRLEHNSHSG